MLLATVIFILIQCVIAVISPTRFIYFSLWIQTMPYTWNWDTQVIYDTPIGRLAVVAIQLFGFCLACFIVVASNWTQAARHLRYSRWHAVFIGFCMFSLVYASSTAYGLRMIAKLLGPFLFMIATLATIRTEGEIQTMRKAILGSGVVIVALALIARAMGINSDPNVTETGLSGLGPPGMGPPVFSAHMLPVAMLALATFLIRPRITGVALVIMSALAIIAALQRTSAGALYLGFSVIFLFGTRGLWRVLLPVMGFAGLPALMIFSPTFRRRMFFGDADSDKLLADPTKAAASVNGSGRFDLWDNMLGRFFSPHPITGSGIGSTQEYFYSHGGGGVVHSEYVRLLCEVGIVGLLLFVLALISYFWRLRTYASKFSRDSQRIPALAAIGSLVTYAIYCSTDNAFDYVSQFGIYVFGLVAIAVKAGELASPAVQGEVAEALTSPTPLFPNLMR
jgi:O-antigen ligase